MNRRVLVAVAVALIVAVAIGGVVAERASAARASGSGDRLVQARGLAAAGAAPRTQTVSPDAAANRIAQASRVLLDEGRSCQRRAKDSAPCLAVLSAAGWAETASVSVLRCSAPQAAAVASDLVHYVDAVRASRPPSPAPTLPSLPSCGGRS